MLWAAVALQAIGTFLLKVGCLLSMSHIRSITYILLISIQVMSLGETECCSSLTLCRNMLAYSLSSHELRAPVLEHRRCALQDHERLKKIGT
jgi:hypothetical protein